MTLIERFEQWYAQLKRYSQDFPARGTISGALVVLDRLISESSLDIDSYTAAGGSQIKGASGEAIKRILAKFGESRPFVLEGGRTNRGLRGDIIALLTTIKESEFEKLTDEGKADVVEQMQTFLVQKVIEYHNRKRISFIYSPSKTTWENIHALLLEAKETNKEGPLAQYLVGAKLALRFPEMVISNESYSTADVQLGRAGDFLIGDTPIHVTIAPMPPVYEKCRSNIDNGQRPWLLVPNDMVVGSKQNADQIVPGQVTVESIETFISQNLEELSEFSSRNIFTGMLRLLEKYNERVDFIENDKSMLIEIPNNIRNA